MDAKQAAQVMGMKPREIVDVKRVSGGHAVTTHDGVVTLVTPDGECLPYSPLAVEELSEPPTPPADQSSADLEPVGEVPDGTEKDVLAWVGDRKDRATLALAAENAKESPRKGLVDKLGKLAG